jgi:hypothetical protein
LSSAVTAQAFGRPAPYRKDYEPWLSGKAGLELLKPAAENVLQKWPVSRRVNSSRAPDDDPTLIDRIPLRSEI